ncbi:MAG: hypothetical protein K2F60_01485, partial [Oscillospiraceae bacterium]|nr:hypothetical protein [Oscillospiraceae bacterium]
TKLGISANVMSAILYFTALFGGYVPLFIAAGYVLIREENTFLRKSAYKSVALLLFFSGLSMILSSLNEILSIFGNLFDTFIEVPLNFDDILISVILLIKTVVFVIFGIMAFKQEDIRIPPIDDAVDKN